MLLRAGDLYCLARSSRLSENGMYTDASHIFILGGMGMEHQLPLTTLCYIEKDGKYLMLHRVSKDQDVNKGKWIGVGGHFEAGESPEECLVREVREETGLEITSWRFRGILTFASEGWPDEYICLYTADCPCEEKNACCAEAGPQSNAKNCGMDADPKATFENCDEGELAWVSKEDLLSLNLWDGDRIFLKLLLEDAPFFSLKLSYRGDELIFVALDGRELDPSEACRCASKAMGLSGMRDFAATEAGTARTSGSAAEAGVARMSGSAAETGTARMSGSAVQTRDSSQKTASGSQMRLNSGDIHDCAGGAE